MLVQRISVIAIFSTLAVGCGTNQVRVTPASTTHEIPTADPLPAGFRSESPRYITQHTGKRTAQQYAQLQQQEVAQQRYRQEQEQIRRAAHQKWEQEQARQQREAEQRYEAEKQRIIRAKYHQKYQQEQMRLAQQKLAAEKQRLTRLRYQREWEEKQREEAEQRKLAQQQRAREVEQQRLILAQRRAAEQEEKLIRARAQKRWEQQQAQKRQPQNNIQRVAQRRPVQHINLQPANRVYRGAGKYTSLPDKVASNLRLRGVSERGMSAYVRPANGKGSAILTAAADKPRNPASTMKLVTSYAALGTLGPNYRWPTELYTNGQIVNGTLRGDVIIKGYGDPDLDEADLRKMLQALRSRGVRNITGNLVTDLSYFNIPYQDPGAFDGNARASYNAQPEALLYQGRGSNYKFRSLAKKVARRAGRPKNSRARADLNRNLFGAFWKVWVGQMNGNIQGDLKKGNTPRGARMIYRHQSKPLRQVLLKINKNSNNVMARQLLLTIGAQVNGAPGTPKNGAMAIGRFLESRGLHFPELRIENGSGLSRISRISARHLGEMLVDAYNSPWRHDYMNSLAVMGVDGTLRNRMKKTVVRGRGHFKTGTLRNVRGLAGYVKAADGQTYVVSILHNDRKARSKARSAHDEMVKWVYWGPRRNFASR